jgi:hypothetical protein
VSTADEGFSIESEHAFVACACAHCVRCRAAIEVIALYCARGRVADESLGAFSLQGLRSMNGDLAQQLARWQHFRFDARAAAWLNHCPRCGAVQPELGLYEEPGQPFYGMPACVTRPVAFVALQGRVRMSGDYCVDM